MALLMSAAFTLGSILPYKIGFHLEHKIKGRVKEKLELAQYWFRRYGVLSVALTRPFTIGMYISYAAGIGKIKPLRYTILTFLGILPWSFGILYISKALNGNLSLITNYLSMYFVPIAVLSILSGGVYILLVRRRKKEL